MESFGDEPDASTLFINMNVAEENKNEIPYHIAHLVTYMSFPLNSNYLVKRDILGTVDFELMGIFTTRQPTKHFIPMKHLKNSCQ